MSQNLTQEQTSYDNNMSIPVLQQASLRNVRIADDWFDRYTKLVQSAILPYQWAALNDELPDTEPSYSVENFRRAGMKNRGELPEDLPRPHFRGMIFQDSDTAKWLEAVGFSLATEPNEELEAQADSLIELVAEAQEADGYLDTYFTLEHPEMKWHNPWPTHELYVSGHFIEAGVAYYLGTGKTVLLDVVKRNADLLCSVFGPDEGQIHGYPGHEGVELALIKLWRVTDVQAYLDLARYFVLQRGQQPNFFIEERHSESFFAYYPGSADGDPVLEYHQAAVPVKKQEHAEGHAVRAVYYYSAVADVAAATGDQELLDAAERLWRDIAEHQLYVTGSIGQSGILERFTTPDDLPNDGNYSETCASIGLAMFSERMGRIKRDVRYHDVVENALFNTVLAGINLEGDRFFYVNPMEVWPDNCMDNTSRQHVKAERQAWFGCACCPPNVARTLANLGQYIYGTDAEAETIYLQQYIGNETSFDLDGNQVVLHVSGDYTVTGTVTLSVEAENKFTLALRKPGWSSQLDIDCEADLARSIREDAPGFTFLDLPAGKTELKPDFNMQAQFVQANPAIRADRGLVALTRGSLVYCLEEIDNDANLWSLIVDPSDEALLTETQLDELGGYVAVNVEGWREDFPEWPADTLYLPVGEQNPQLTNTKIRFLPYALWQNRGKSKTDAATPGK